MLTKKEFIELAKTTSDIMNEIDGVDFLEIDEECKENYQRSILKHIINFCKKQNPRFNTRRFRSEVYK